MTMMTWQTMTESEAQRAMDAAEEDGERIMFLVPPKLQGQAVEHAFAALGGQLLLRRSTDRSDGSVTYSARTLAEGDETMPGLNFEPA